MLVPKRETIRSKQLSLPGDKQMGFDRILGKQKYKSGLKKVVAGSTHDDWLGLIIDQAMSFHFCFYPFYNVDAC